MTDLQTGQKVLFRMEGNAGKGRWLNATVIHYGPDFGYGGMWRDGEVRVEARGVTREIYMPAVWCKPALDM